MKKKFLVALTSAVASPLTAQLVSARGHNLVMPASLKDIEYGLSQADALLINLGMLDSRRLSLSRYAVRIAQKYRLPWVLDPVGAGGSVWRSAQANWFMEQRPGIIKGNAAEIRALAGEIAKLRGMDSLDRSLDCLNAARKLNVRQVWVTGEWDLIFSKKAQWIEGGHVWMPRLVTLGCALGALAALESTRLVALAHEVKQAGAYAAQQSEGLGSFQSALVDAMTR